MEVVSLTALVAVVGLLVGSFLNVVVHRVPRGESVVHPRSRCPGCETEIRPLDNVPVLSWLVLRGRCRTCRVRISPRYPLIELLTGATFAILAVRFGLDAALPAYLLLAAAGIAVAAIDLEHLRIPTRLVWPALGATAIWLGGVSAVRGDMRSLAEGVAGALLAGAPLFLANLAYPAGMGFGDVRLATYLGFPLGWLAIGLVAVGLMSAFVAASVVGVALLAAGRGRKTRIPFGPYLVAGALFAVLAGRAVVDRYVELFGV